MKTSWSFVALLPVLLTTASYADETVTQNKHGKTNFTTHNGRADHATSTLGAVQAGGNVAQSGDHLVATPSGTHGVTGTPSTSATATAVGPN